MTANETSRNFPRNTNCYFFYMLYILTKALWNIHNHFLAIYLFFHPLFFECNVLNFLPMAMQQIIATSSSSCLKKYDVFISFRGADTRRKFTSYLYDALSKKALTFIDEHELEKGDEISSTLIKSIEEAYVSVVIFSQDYASSKWCLNELVKILECKEDQGQIVIPVFYEIDPTHVRNQTGSYGQAFEKHEQDLRHNKDKLQKWRNALTQAANLSGWNSQEHRIESNFIKNIVEDVFKQLNRKLPFEVNKKMVGIEKKYEEIEMLLKSGSADNDVTTLGLWGMGGMGKTTLAKYAYDKLSFQFERRCFLENVREESTRSGLPAVRKLFLSKLFECPVNALDVDTGILERRLASEKCLIVLDDVATLEQAENLKMCFGPGSRVIVTTRDKEIFSEFNGCKIHEVQGLDEDDSIQLFCVHAFQTSNTAKVGYEDLSERATRYCGGNPLALKVLGANLGTKSKQVWESELEKLKKIPNGKIHEVLKLSFNDLDSAQQDIFLDIACFFELKLHYRDGDDPLMTEVLDACGFFAASGIEALCNKALITRNSDSIEMHDLLVEMGREIVNEKSRKHPGRRSRLWDSKEVYDVLKYNKGTEDVEVISFYMEWSKIEDLYLSSDSFKSMINLRYLHITYNSYFESKVHFSKGLKWLSDELRYLRWDLFPLKSLPSTFCPEKLVVLKMTRGKFKKLWDGIKKLDNLMILDLKYSRDLIEIPDLSGAPNLEIVDLSGCESLRQLHPSVFACPKLRKLLLSGCEEIKSLKTEIHSKSLEVLVLSGCYSLVEFSVSSEEMTSLALSNTAIREFPSSIWRNSKLTQLFLDGCRNLNIVRNKLSSCDLGGLRSLTYLNLSGCIEINTSNLWSILDGMPSLYYLDLRRCMNLETLPDNIEKNSSLGIIKLDESMKLRSLPKLPTFLKQLTAFNCIYLQTNILHRFHFNTDSDHHHGIFCIPGGQVPSEFDYHTTKASIDIPPIPKSGLCGFIFCIILSHSLNFRSQRVSCTLYEHGEEILDLKELFVIENIFGKTETLIIDHVLLCSWTGGNYKLVNRGNESDHHHNLSFEFKLYEDDDKKQWSTEGIKGCGVIPVYDLEHSLQLQLDGRSSSGIAPVPDQPPKFDIDAILQIIPEEDLPPQMRIKLKLEMTEKLEKLSDQHSKFDFVKKTSKNIRNLISKSFYKLSR